MLCNFDSLQLAMLPTLIRGGCISNGRCEKFCTSFQEKKDSDDSKCGWCDHHICEHAVIGVVDCNGKYTPSGVTAVPSQPASIPVSSARDRNLNFNRAWIFIPQSAGIHKVGIVVVLC